MTTHTLKEARRRYDEFDRHGDLTLIARYLGQEAGSPGPKYLFQMGALEVYWDGYGQYTTVRTCPDRRRLYSSHPTERIMVDGNWIDKLLEFKEAAEQAKAAVLSKSRLDQQRRDSKTYAPFDF